MIPYPKMTKNGSPLGMVVRYPIGKPKERRFQKVLEMLHKTQKQISRTVVSSLASLLEPLAHYQK